MSTLYPRLIEVHRVKTSAVSSGTQNVGLTTYSGAEQSTTASDADGEAVLFTNIPCSIQADSLGRTRNGMLPTDITAKPTWLIIIPSSALPQYSVRDRDIIVDDEGYRYGVAQNAWTVLGYNLSVIRE